ncbi:MAG: type II secretion system F family protein [Chlorobaculum sp.]|jgi:tight adherence protein B|nr:type II secretion system F family protein [Chlorobaculum sp.]
MSTFLIPFIAFVAVLLIMLLLYWVWERFFDVSKKAKKQRVQAINNAVHSTGQNVKSASSVGQGSELESLLRARSKTFKHLDLLVKRSHSPIPAMRLMFIMLASITIVLIIGLMKQTNIFLLIALAAAIDAIPVLWLSYLANQRCKAFEKKMPETLDYISRSLRVGHSLTSAMGRVGKEFPDPIGTEFKTVFDEINFGISFKEAIGQLSDRVKSKDLNFMVIALIIQHDTGGNIAELLDVLSVTMRERFKLRSKVHALSAEGRLSAMILGSLPFVLIGIMVLMNYDYISVLWTEPKGHPLLYIGGGLMVIGFILINRLSDIKV